MLRKLPLTLPIQILITKTIPNVQVRSRNVKIVKDDRRCVLLATRVGALASPPLVPLGTKSQSAPTPSAKVEMIRNAQLRIKDVLVQRTSSVPKGWILFFATIVVVPIRSIDAKEYAINPFSKSHTC